VALRLRGQVIGVLTFIGAESQQRFTMADLRLAENLAERAATAIENARLYHQLKLADQRKDEFLAMLGHELRNPLASIRNALQLMKTPQATGDMIADARETSERQLRHMVRLVDDLLDVSRIMRGRVEIRREMVELEAIVRQGAEIAQPMIDAHGQQLILSLPGKPLYLEADPSRLTQVVSNLLHNAAKFSPHAGRIWLSLEQQGTQAVLNIKDEGAGIRADLLPHVFELFVQGDQTLERTQGGLGIGLTVVRRLIEMHGGNVSAASEGVGLGAEFTITLPGLCEPPPQAAGKTARKVAAIPRRVLVVDDNVDSAETMAEILKLWGHEVQTAHDGVAALEAARAHRPDAVLLDVGLPVMDGYEIARRLRQEGLATLLVAVTGFGTAEDRRRAEEAGFDTHLTKPVSPDALRRVLRGGDAKGQP
jgi:signal transduction histidine kinase/ActR/RegA family two-component response regulator